MRRALSKAAVAVAATTTLLWRAGSATTTEPLPVYMLVSGEEVTHAVAHGETLGHIAQRFGMQVQLAATINRLPDVNHLRLGQRLQLSTRHIVPAKSADSIVINVADLRLYWVRDGALMASFPVGVGREDWETPSGHYTIVGRRRDPVWHVPKSIQREMKDRGEPVKKRVEPGPDNPLGKFWLQLSAPGYGIHGTNAPWSVGKFTTHGCVRLRPDDIEWLFNNVPTGTPVDIIDEPVKVARVGDDTVLLEVHTRSTGHAKDVVGAVVERLQQAGLADVVDLNAAARVVRDGWGVAIDVSKKPRAPGDVMARGAAGS